jgi:hypothetical protein
MNFSDFIGPLMAGFGTVTFSEFYLILKWHGCQRFMEPVLSPLLYKITPYLQEVIERAKL